MSLPFWQTSGLPSVIAGAAMVRIGTFAAQPSTDVLFEVDATPRFVDLPGDAGFVEIENLGPDALVNPTVVFEIAI